ncbi:Uncharacterised protein [Mycobacterium tuberculosis]|nr:Uncharacterised protein [Mycobacterium tuberculosis]
MPPVLARAMPALSFGHRMLALPISTLWLTPRLELGDRNEVCPMPAERGGDQDDDQP